MEIVISICSCFKQDVEIIEEGAKHTLTLYNCKVAQTGEVVFQGANAKCAANLKVKGILLQCSLVLFLTKQKHFISRHILKVNQKLLLCYRTAHHIPNTFE